MIIDEILTNFEGGGQHNFYSFETFILNLLKYHIEQQGNKFVLVENIRGLGDAYAEDGFDSFKGKTLIEIRFSLDRIPSRIFIDQLVSRLTKSEKYEEFENFLIISYKPVSARFKARLIEEVSKVNERLKVVIWGPEEINKIVSKHKKHATTIASNLFSLRLETAVSKETGDWEKEREERIGLLIDFYERGQFALFLGAGVSSSAGMPDWNTLLNSLFVSYLTKEFTTNTNISDEDIKQIVIRLNEIDEPSALMAARYLRKGLSKEASEAREFTNIITDNLYKLRNTQRDLNSALIVSIANLCMPRRTGAKVRSVITYNFDDLIERGLQLKSIQHRSIYTDNEAYDPDELPIYHVHGFLPEDVKTYERLEKSTLVFSEEGYHQIYTEAYHWSNLVQLTNLRENNCLMIGLSMTDPNLRRLLDISARNLDRPKHFAFMRRMTLDMFVYSSGKDGGDGQVIKNTKGAEQFLNRHHKLNEEIMKELGVSIIWFNDFDEIPQILSRINGK
ncbi:SIR2 family protein [uncultured Chitinophaga sp.]|jgi:hypothetical protein|uniref:SIR2 family protein n=1 Tax=uncultured Chitinophaga sp. TaxID=339340 RepID=UPI002620F963|nr:SIR2 family protein [uncultured Chitinophaga sp.]